MSFEEKLILEVQKYPVLYQKCSGGYKNVSLKFKIWSTIGEKLGQTDEVCQKRWKSLRDRYSREKNKLLMPSGIQVSNPNDWEHWNSLGFLNDYIIPRNRNFIISDQHAATRPSSSMSINQVNEAIEFIDTGNVLKSDCSQFEENTSRKRTYSESTNIENSNSNSDVLYNPTPQKKTKSCDNFLEKLIETMEVFQKHLNKSAQIPVEETANSSCMKSATIILSSLQPINQIRARAYIMKYLCDLQMEELINK